MLVHRVRIEVGRNRRLLRRPPAPLTHKYIFGGSTLTLAAREGDPAPGLGAEIEFAGFEVPVFGPGGELAFIAQIRGPGVTMNDNRCLYIRDSAGTLHLVLRSGEPYNPGTGTRTIEEFLIDQDPTQTGHAAFVNTGAGPTLFFKMHFRDPPIPPSPTPVRASGIFEATLGAVCYPNCDGSTTAPILNVADFTCFLTKFAAGDPYANCDGSTVPPVLNIADFSCFLQQFAAGCR
jgi:hypothetical protein